MLDVRVGEWLCKEGLPLHSVLPEHFGTDVRQSVYRNLKDGKLLLLTGSRFYLHDPDRTLCIEEYYYGQGWGTDIQIDTLHHPVPLLKQIKKTPATAASTVQASPKKKRTRSQATSAEPKDKATARGNKGTGKTGRGAQPWFCKGVELMGNAVNLSDFAAWFLYKSVHMFIFNSTESHRDKSGTNPGQIRDNFRRPPSPPTPHPAHTGTRGLFAPEAPSFRIRHMHTRTSHAHTQLRLARTHDTNETKAKSKSISRLGSLRLVPPTSNIYILIYLYKYISISLYICLSIYPCLSIFLSIY